MNITRLSLPSLLALAVTAVTLSGCSTLTTATHLVPTGATHASSQHHATPMSAASHHTSPSPSSAGLQVADGHGWTDAGLDGTAPAPGSCHLRWVGGEPLNDLRCNPGAIDPAVTQANIHTTICRPGGYTSSVRPPESVTEPAKYAMMAAYGIPASEASATEGDHLIPLELGGASSLANYYPEPNNDARHYQRNQYVHNDADELESLARKAVCDGRVSLAAAQRAFATDWTTVATLLGLPRP